MKAIMVMFDSLNRHMLPPYGAQGIHAPNFERLVERSAMFTNCYVGSMPCIPARRELHTGRYNFLHRSWGPLEPFDDSMPALLGQHGVYTHLTTDHQHYFEDGGATYHSRYHTWEFARGQEGDQWKGEVNDPTVPEMLNPRSLTNWHHDVGARKRRQDWVNRQYMQDEAQHPQTVTFDRGLEFIQTNHAADNWFLQIECFDPHEPFFSYEQYRSLYPHEYDGPHYDWPDYDHVRQTPLEVQHARFQYAALVSQCDASLGRVLDAMDELDLWQDTMLIVTTDHGYLLGEHDWWAKNKMPWYNELAHTPLFIWDPRSRVMGEQRDGLVQMIDIPATLLEFFGVKRPKDMQGMSLRDSIAHNAPTRDACLFGTMGGHVNVTDGRYVYMRGPVTPDNTPLYEYTLMPTHMEGLFAIAELQDIQLAEPFSFTKGCRVNKIEARKWAVPELFKTLLFDLETDPRQENPIRDAAVEQRMIAHMLRMMQDNDAPPEQYERLGLPELVFA
jgi:arylsulfatase A-like enzyme